ncbi:MAG: patatin-like phospholipase family protein, partial [Oscillospiraceae bacterium]
MIKKALVLAGGGSRGSYQLGVWRAAKEIGMEFNIVTGASVGALNGALIVQDDYELAKKLWENISSADVLKLDGIEDALEDLSNLNNRKHILRAFATEAVGKGGADITPLAEMIDQYLNEDKIRKSPVDFGLITVEYPSFN